METGSREKRTCVCYYVGPFLSEVDAVAFAMMNMPNEPSNHARYRVEEWDARMVNYYADLAAEMRGVDECRLILPAEARLVRKGWNSPHVAVRDFCLEEAKKMLNI
jgi:hypothetical protein